MKMKKYRLPIIMSIITFVILIGGLTYAYFVVFKEAPESNVLTVGTFNIEFLKGDTINLKNTYPMNEGRGQKTDPFEMNIKNNNEVYACFTVELIDKYVEPTQSFGGNSTLIRNQLRYSFNGELSKKVPDENIILYNSGINPGSSKTFKFRLWIDELETIASAANKDYYGKLVVKASNCKKPEESTTIGAPIVSGSVVSYVQSQTINVSTPATFSNGTVESYEYYINPDNSNPPTDAIGTLMDRTSVTINIDQNGSYIFIRGISNNDEKSPWSNPIQLFVDISAPAITVGPESEEIEKTKTIVLYFNDFISGISNYQVTQSKTMPTTWFTITNSYSSDVSFTATANGTYYVWAKDAAGNISKPVEFKIANIGIPPTPATCFNFNSTTQTITGYNGITENCPSDVVIPSKISDIEVLIIGSNAFQSKNITSLIIPDSVNTIGSRAFEYNLLEKLIIPNSVTSIGDSAFAHNKIIELVLGNNVQAIGQYAFYDNQIAALTIPSSVTTIKDYAFWINKLTSIIIPDSVTALGRGVFQDNLITTISFPQNITAIPNQLFNDNKLTSLIIPESIITIGSGAFDTNEINYLKLGNNIQIIGDSAFNRNRITNITLPDSVVSLAGFSNNLLTSITIPDNVETIGNCAFCVNQLTDLTIPNKVKTIGRTAFSGNLLTNVIIGNNVETIVYGAFSDNQLTNITIPASVTSIGDIAFENSSGYYWNTVTILGENVQRFNSNWRNIGWPYQLMP